MESTQTTPNAQHHDFSPSKLPMLMACPGAYKMQQGIADVQSPEAQEGSMLHECVATGKLDGLNSEQETAVTSCLDFLAKLAGEGAKVYREMPMTVKDADGSVLTSGTCDIAIEYPDGRLAVIDWKFGRKAVADVNRNMQLASYAVGAMQELGHQSCECHVYQPRIYAHSAYTFARPDAILANIRNIISKCQCENLLLCPGEHCAYCKAKGRCPAFMAKFKALAEPLADWQDSPEQIVALYEQSKVVEKFCREVKAALEAYISAHGKCGGYIYREKPGNREIGDISSAYSALQDYITQQELLGQCKVSVSGLTDVLVGKMQAQAQAAGGKLTKVAAKAKIEELLAPYIQRGTPTKTIVME